MSLSNAMDFTSTGSFSGFPCPILIKFFAGKRITSYGDMPFYVIVGTVIPTQRTKCSTYGLLEAIIVIQLPVATGYKPVLIQERSLI
jgi:hypothetical protein